MRVNRRIRSRQMGLMNSLRGRSPRQQFARLAAVRGIKEPGANVTFNVEKLPAAPTVTPSAMAATTVTLTASAFAPITEGRTYVQTEFQVDEAAGDWSTPVATDTETDNVSNITGLTASTAYKARARHVDNKGNGAWSTAAAFSTTA